MQLADRQEKWWRILREGEVSPFKILVVILIREKYAHQDLRNGTPEERCASLLFIYKMTKSHDMSYPEFRQQLEDPKNCIRPETLKRFTKVLQNLEEVNASFFYELVHTVILMESSMSHMHILRKRIARNSPIGKFLRMVLLNLRKMTFPQSLYLYNQLGAYLHPYIELKRTIFPKTTGSGKERDSESRIKIDIPVVKKEVEDPQDPPPKEPTTPAVEPGPSTSSASSAAATTPKAPAANKVEKKRRHGLDAFANLMRQRKRNDLRGLHLCVRGTYEVERLRHRKSMTSKDETAYAEQRKSKDQRVRLALERVKLLRESWYPTIEAVPPGSATKGKMNVLETSFGNRRTKVKPSPKKMVGKSPRKPKAVPNEIDILGEGDSDYFFSDDDASHERDISAPVKKSGRSSASSSRKHDKGKHIKHESEKKKKEFAHTPKSGSKRWNEIKFWSRKQIELTVKKLADELFSVKSKKYTPVHVSSFIEAIKQNPSAALLLPQLNFLEYLNSLRIRDIVRCKESLRTSFDLRIKPNTSELNKGTPYAAYNFAVFYAILGYRKDSLKFLEEAFQAGHGAADGSCLNCCHHLWTIFHSKPYPLNLDLQAGDGKESENHMAYLSVLRDVVHAIDEHYSGKSLDESIVGLFGKKEEPQDHDNVRLLALNYLFSSSGWHSLVGFACQTILYSKIKWSATTYCAALCMFAQNLLVEGDVQLAQKLMDHGQRVFSMDWSPAGDMFVRLNALFGALVAYLAHKPVPTDILALLATIDPIEQCYWITYTKMVEADWEGAEKCLKSLSNEKLSTVKDRFDLHLRCLILQAEIDCLCGKPTTAMKRLFEAYEFASSLHSDHYISLSMINLASIQCELGMPHLASKTLYKNLRALCRSYSPLISARYSLLTIKLRLTGCKTPVTSSTVLKNYQMLLDEAESTYTLWDNEYRLKEVRYWKTRLTEAGDSEVMLVDEEVPVSQFQVLFSPRKCIV